MAWRLPWSCKPQLLNLCSSTSHCNKNPEHHNVENKPLLLLFSQSQSRVWLFEAPCTIAHQAPLSSMISWSLLKFRSIESVMLSNHLILCCPLLFLPSIFLSIRGFSSELALCIKYWRFSFINSPFKEYSGLISFRIDRFDFLAIQGTLRNLLHHNSKASILQHSAFFMVQL